MKKITEQVAKTRQGVLYTQILSDGGVQFRVAIYSDSYDFQSTAVVTRWDGNQWQHVHNIPFALMATRHGLCYEREPVTAAAFAADCKELIRVAKAVVGVAANK